MNNVASGEVHTNNEILEMFKEQFPWVEITNAPRRPGDVMHTEADVTRAEKELGYSPSFTFRQGLEKTWEWWGNLED